MKKSFLRRLLLGTISIIVFTFILQIVAQRLVLPWYFTNDVRDTIEEEIATLPEEITMVEVGGLINDFTNETHTTVSLMNLHTIEDQQFSTISFEVNGETYKIWNPRNSEIEINVGDDISGDFVKVTEEVYLPLTLFVNGEEVYGSKLPGKMLNSRMGQDVLESDAEMIDSIALEGTVTSIQNSNATQSDMDRVSSEYINLLTGSINEVEEYDRGYSYISYYLDGESANIVYVIPIDVDGLEQNLVAIYPLSNISSILRTSTELSLYIFTFSVIGLVAFFYLYLRRVSTPLKNINEAAKEIANLNFTKIENIKNEDELGEISKNINIMSGSLENSMLQLKQQNESLSNTLNQESERDVMRQDFVAGISHELKTPLAVIQAANEAIELGIIDKTDEYHDIIKKEISKSNKILQDMIHVYQFDRKEYQSNFEQNNVKEVLISALSNYKTLLDAKNIMLTTHLEDFHEEFDFDKILLVVNNILSNAIKYNINDGMLNVIMEDRKVIIENTGSRIPEDKLDKIFEPFYRVDEVRSRADGSTGLGLYIVKQILDQHNANYHYENTDIGVRFVFEL